MPVYHSSFNDEAVQIVCGCSMLPIKTTTRGPAPLATEGVNAACPTALRWQPALLRESSLIAYLHHAFAQGKRTSSTKSSDTSRPTCCSSTLRSRVAPIVS